MGWWKKTWKKITKSLGWLKPFKEEAAKVATAADNVSGLSQEWSAVTAKYDAAITELVEHTDWKAQLYDKISQLPQALMDSIRELLQGVGLGELACTATAMFLLIAASYYIRNRVPNDRWWSGAGLLACDVLVNCGIALPVMLFGNAQWYVVAEVVLGLVSAFRSWFWAPTREHTAAIQQNTAAIQQYTAAIQQNTAMMQNVKETNERRASHLQNNASSSSTARLQARRVRRGSGGVGGGRGILRNNMGDLGRQKFKKYGRAGSSDKKNRL